MSEIKVSVIVPVYNTEKYLVNCLESLVNQTLQEIQIVIINDGSTDSSLEIIKSYSEKYPNKIVYETQENSGQGVARNRALELCTGEYIGFLDSDDEASVHMFEKMYDEAVCRQADMVICDYWFVTKKGKIKKIVKKPTKQKNMLIDAFVDPWNKLIKTDILKKNDIKFPEGYFYEDTGWFACVVPFVNNCIKIDEAFPLHYKRKDSSMTALDDQRVAHIFPVMNSIISFYKEKNIYESFYKELEYFYTKILLCSSMLRIARVQNQNIRRTLVKSTFSNLNKNFPNYKKNPYLKGRVVGKYIKFISTGNSGVVLMLLNVKNIVKELKE